jgi:RNA polymerase sigma-70 factor (ECF subfamily)
VTANADLAARFQAARPHLGALAYRMLGSVDDAEDAVQEAWLRLSGIDGREVTSLDAWLTTVVARICLNTLRSRRARPREELVARVPDPIVDAVGEPDPEHQAMLADAVGLALFVILDTLPPAERLAFVLHDVFAIPFDQIAPIVERSPEATRKLASRARRRIHDAAPSPDTDLVAQHAVVDAFFAAGRAGDFDRLVAVLDPDVSLRGDFGPGGQRTVRGASAVAGLARGYADPAREVRPAVVNGAAGAVIFVAGEPTAVMADPARVARVDVSAVTG